MPIVEIYMMNSGNEILEKLAVDIEDAFLSITELKLVHGEILINYIPTLSHDDKRFLYIKIWLYKKWNRNKRVQRLLQNRVARVLEKYIGSGLLKLDHFEILPLFMLSTKDCLYCSANKSAPS